MPGETDVINVGLRKVGAERIVAFPSTDGSKSGNVANDIYTELRDDLLRSHFWNFATVREKLAQVTDVPVFEYDHAYAYPSDWIKTISVHNNDAGHGTFDYRSEFLRATGQRIIVTSSDDVWMRYVYRVTDPNFMTADFRQALEFALAREFSIPLASSNTLYDKYEKKAASKLAAARSSDAIGSPPERRPKGSWVTSRGGNVGGIDDHHHH